MEGSDQDPPQLFAALREGQELRVQELLGEFPSTALTRLLNPRPKGSVARGNYGRGKVGRAKQSAAAKERCLQGWMGRAALPWNPNMWQSTANYRCTCLHLAAALGQSRLCRLLLDKGAEPSARDSLSNPVILLAASSGDVETLRVILAAGGLTSEENNDRVTALHVACKEGTVAMVTALLQGQGDGDGKDQSWVNKASRFKDELPLLCAAFYGHVGVVELLLGRGANVDQASDLNLTALHMAARKGHCQVMTLLLQHGAKVNALARVGRRAAKGLRFPSRDLEIVDGTPLHFAVACPQDSGAAVQLLLDHGADLDTINHHHHYSPLLVAAAKAKVGVARQLVAAGARVNRPGIRLRGEEEASSLSPLLVAISCYHPGGWAALEDKVKPVITYFLEAGADLDAQCGQTGKGVVHFSVDFELREVFAQLLEAGAEPWDVDYHDRSPIAYCLSGRHGNPRPWLLKCLQAGVLSKETMGYESFRISPLDLALMAGDVHLLRMYRAAGLVSRHFLSDHIREEFKNCKIYKEFRTAMASVPSLMEASRKAVSEAIGCRAGRRAGIASLPVEPPLRRYLMYDDLQPLLAPPPMRHMGVMGQRVPVGIDPPLHSVSDRELIEELGSDSEIIALDDHWDSDSWGSGSSYEPPYMDSESDQDIEFV